MGVGVYVCGCVSGNGVPLTWQCVGKMMIDHGIKGVLFFSETEMKAFAIGLTTANVKEQEWQRLLSSAPVALYSQQILE